MPILQVGTETSAPDSANSAVQAAVYRLSAGVPADQAVGLRLLALARTAAAVHLAESTSQYLARSQAAALLEEVG